MAEPDTAVIIVGAGSTGLLLAQGLRAAGIPSRIFEQHAADRAAREWSMSMHWGGEFLFKTLPLDLQARLPEINVDPGYDFSSEKGYVQCNGETGDVILVMQGTMPRRVSRRKLLKLLSSDLNIEYGKTLDKFYLDTSGASPLVTAHFTDSTRTTARVLIGADGSRSRVRHLMVDEPERANLVEMPYSIVNFSYVYPEETVKILREIHPVFKCGYHPKIDVFYMTSLLSAPDPATGAVTFQNLLSWKGPPYPEQFTDRKELLYRFKVLGSQFAPPFRAAALGVTDGYQEVFVDRGTQWDPRSVFRADDGRGTWNEHYFHGCVTLAGDAAHPMLPHRGQGFNNALEDASRLLEALKGSIHASNMASDASFKAADSSLEAEIATYEKEMVARGGLEVEVTAKAAMAAHDWNMLMQSPMFQHGANKSTAK